MRTTEFKQTELGPIPADWEVKRIDQCGDVITGSTPPRDISDLWNGSFNWISAKDFKGKYITESEEKVTERGKRYCRPLPKDSILITCIASIGLNAIAKQACATNQQINAIVCKNCDFEYVYYQCCFSAERLRQIAGQTAVPIVGKSQFEAFQIAFPQNQEEQRRIAAALSDVDDLIGSLGKLVEKKRAIKTSAMQQLLTGHTRLPGFGGKWVEKRLGDCGEFIGGGTPSTTIASYWGEDIDWYTPAEIGNTKYVNGSNRRITREGLGNCAARLLPIGTILLTTRASIGLRAILKHEAATNQGFQSLVVNAEFDSEFMYYYLSTIVEEMESRASGSTFLEISSSKLKEIPIVVPPSLPEQQSIAGVLSDMDAEIAALEAEKRKVEAIKQGMMQELLTGRVGLFGSEKKGLE